MPTTNRDAAGDHPAVTDGASHDAGPSSGAWDNPYVCETVGWGTPEAVAFAPDGRSVALGSYSVERLDATTGAILDSYHGLAAPAGSVAFSPDGTLLAAAVINPSYIDANYGIVVWRVADRSIVWAMRSDHRYNTTRLTFSPDSSTLAISRGDGVRLVRATSGEATATFKGHASGARYAAFSPDGSMVASTDLNAAAVTNNVLLWRVADLSLVRSLSVAKGANQPVFSPDGNQLLVSGGNGFARFQVSDGSVIQTDTRGTGAVSWAPDGGSFFVGGIWRTSDGLLLRSVTAGDAVFAPDGRGVLIAPGYIWSPTDGSKTIQFSGGSPLVAQSFVVHEDAKLITFNANPQAPQDPLSPDGTLRAADSTGPGAVTGQILITRVADNSLVSILGTANLPVAGAVWSPDGTHLATAGGGGIVVWKVADWTIEKKFVTDNYFSKMIYLPDGRSLLTNGNSETIIWDAVTGKRVASFPIFKNSGCGAGALDVACDRAGDLIASASMSGTFLWSPVDNHVIARLPSPSKYQIAFTSFGFVTLGDAPDDSAASAAYRWCPGAIPVASDGGVPGDGGSDAPSGSDGGVGNCSDVGGTRGDFDGDGVTDCVVFPTGSADILFYRGSPGLGFSATAVITPGIRAFMPAIMFPAPPRAIDMTGDGRDDLLVLGSLGPSMGTGGYLLLGQADGTFWRARPCGAGTDFFASGSWYGNIVADFTNDGKKDLWGMNVGSPTAPGTAQPLVYNVGNAGPGSGETGSPFSLALAGGSASAAAAGDVDGDGDLDGFVILTPATTSSQPTSVYIAWGNGVGTLFSRTPTPQSIVSLAGATALTTGDFNGDAKLDLLVSFDTSPPSVRYLGDGTGNFILAP